MGVSEALQARVAHYQQLLPQVQSRPRHADMPYRLLNDRMRARLQATLDDGEGAYAGPDELIDYLQITQGHGAALEVLHRLEQRRDIQRY